MLPSNIMAGPAFFSDAKVIRKFGDAPDDLSTTLQFICAEIERLHLQIRRQQKTVFTRQRSGIGTSLAELLLADAGF